MMITKLFTRLVQLRRISSPSFLLSGQNERNYLIQHSQCLSTGVSYCLYRKALPTTDEDLETLSSGDKVLKLKLATTRLDGILKAGLQISKSKIEKAFYEDRIRLNGERPRKKSQQLDEGDEVDLIRNFNRINRNFLDVSRVEIVKLSEDGVGAEEDEYSSDDDDEKAQQKIQAVLKRYKSLTIENYDEAWKDENS